MVVSTCLHGIVFGMISYRRRPAGDMYRAVHLIDKGEDEENVVLATKGKKKKLKKSSEGGTKQ